jgi:hypothetical protein
MINIFKLSIKYINMSLSNFPHLYFRGCIGNELIELIAILAVMSDD